MFKAISTCFKANSSSIKTFFSTICKQFLSIKTTLHLFFTRWSITTFFGPFFGWTATRNSRYFLYLSAASVISCDIAEKMRLQIKPLKWRRVPKGRHTFQTAQMFAVSSARPLSAVTASTRQVITLIIPNCGPTPPPIHLQGKLKCQMRGKKKKKEKKNSHGLQKQKRFCLVERTSK